MTKDQFIAALRDLSCSWRLFEGAIYSEHWRCIFTELAAARGKIYPVTEWQRAATYLGIMREAVHDILMAADNEKNHDPALRRKLLQATGLIRAAVTIKAG